MKYLILLLLVGCVSTPSPYRGYPYRDIQEWDSYFKLIQRHGKEDYAEEVDAKYYWAAYNGPGCSPTIKFLVNKKTMYIEKKEKDSSFLASTVLLGGC